MADNKASSHGCKSIALFKRDDIHTSPLMPLLSDNMRSARHRYRKQLEEEKSDKKDGRVTKKSLKKKNYKENESVKVKLLQKAYKPSLANVSVLESQEIAQEIVVANNSVMETSYSAVVRDAKHFSGFFINLASCMIITRKNKLQCCVIEMTPKFTDFRLFFVR